MKMKVKSRCVYFGRGLHSFLQAKLAEVLTFDVLTRKNEDEVELCILYALGSSIQKWSSIQKRLSIQKWLSKQKWSYIQKWSSIQKWEW